MPTSTNARKQNGGSDWSINSNTKSMSTSWNFTRDSVITKYVVISASTPLNNDTYNYVFYLPLTLLSWKRIGYKTIILITGKESEWKTHKILHLVMFYLNKYEAIIRFIEANEKEQVLLSQVSRIFAVCLFDQVLKDDDIVVISDADLWVLQQTFIPSPNYNEFISLNSYCCGNFRHHGISYQMLPMCHIIGSVRSWRKLAHSFYSCDNNVLDNIKQTVKKGDVNADFDDVKIARDKSKSKWYTDQIMISILMKKYSSELGGKVHHMKKTEDHRLDRNNWYVSHLQTVSDVHLLRDGFKHKQWKKLYEVLIFMFGRKTHELKDLSSYQRLFQHLHKQIHI